MRKAFPILVLSLACLNAWAANSISTEQLKSFLASTQGESDAEVAREIEGLVLTERLNPAQLPSFLAYLHGHRSREALLVLVDMSAFRDPPQSDVPQIDSPDIATQRKMMSLAAQYVSKVRHDLPNFYATRVTATFRCEIWSNTSMRFVGRYSDMEIYRDGLQLRKVRPRSRAAGLTTSGEFGAVLGAAILDAAHGNLAWSHWELGDTGPKAVFRYEVNASESHYVVEDQVTAYKGEITIDPSDGAILRIVWRADPDSALSLRVANIVVEYGTIELGGKSYICPLKGIAFSEGSQLMWLNDTTFEDYHLFRPEMKILPGFEEVK